MKHRSAHNTLERGVILNPFDQFHIKGQLKLGVSTHDTENRQAQVGYLGIECDVKGVDCF